jgi:hypothetical protein
MCPLWWKSSCEIQGMYSLQRLTKQKIPTSPFETIHSCINKTTPIHSTGVTYAQITKQNSHAPINIEQAASSANQQYTKLKKYDE